MNSYFSQWSKKLSVIYENPNQMIRWLLNDMNLASDVLNEDVQSLDQKTQEKLQQYLLRLEQQEPLSKIFQSKEFYGRNFKTTKDTLDPRYETELIIDAVKKYKALPESFSVLELGVGTGCVIISLLLEFQNAKGLGIDICGHALQVAKENKETWHIGCRLDLQISNWFQNIPPSIYDIIISNPPYIENQFPLDKSVGAYDPHLALFGGKDGLEAYKLIFKNVKEYMNEKSIFIIEIGFNQFEAIAELAKNNQLYIIDILKDFQNYNRCVLLKTNNI
ncbi:MAG: peptide chain release factor N(5)-glutamine methyltransferase [Candidatus Puniceispirillum sp.]|nr:peptide chain release factor N(5)-glutamine methyltransferase [Candidatus Pelagibacter sp.]MBA4283017.1 peptide chain release factor N(5)-glutamine methyltransferase [Candidatus Puniceispirillum sp.]